MEAILRYQQIASACVWFTLQLQRDKPQSADPRELDPIDVAHTARHKLITDDAALKKRVVDNKGGSAFTLVEDLTGRSLEGYHWNLIDFTRWYAYLVGCMCVHSCNLRGFGLVTHFCVHDNFWEEPKNKGNMPGQGYWKFDGTSVHCKGEFVHVGADDKCDSERGRLQKMWNEQHQCVVEQENTRSVKMDTLEPLLEPSNLFASAGETSASTGDDSTTTGTLLSPPPAVDITAGERTGMHSMVMLGSYEKEENGTTKRYFMLLNWWHAMPLVLVSTEYLIACQAQVHFLDKPLTEATLLARKTGFVGECSFPDDGEDGPVVLPFIPDDDEENVTWSDLI
jgi:hypothetical protein